MQPLLNGMIFLINMVFDLYGYVIILRLILPWVKADYYNPLSQIVLRLTEPVLSPIRKIIPKMAMIDLSVLFLLFAVVLVKKSLIFLLFMNMLPSLLGLLFFVIADILQQTINLTSFIIIIIVIASWVGAYSHNPILNMLHQIVAPILNVFHRIVPSVGGLDLSPLLAIIALQFISIVFVSQLVDIGRGLI